MKKLFLLLSLVMFAGSIAAQRTVQGIVRNDLKSARTIVKEVTPLDTTFTYQDIKFWVGDGTNKAALVLSWHDGSTTNPDHMVWGYQWPANETRTGLDMIKAIAKADKRLLLLTQYTGPMGYTIDGIGYDKNPENMDITFDAESAQAQVSFTYPADVQDIADEAILNGLSTGIIEHPFDASMGGGRPAYDYDYWIINRDSYPNTHWYAGWHNGYWSYLCRDAKNQSWEYSSWGASSRELTNGTWDSWSYNANMSTMEGTQPGYPLVAATYAPRDIARQVSPVTVSNGKVAYSTSGVVIENLKGGTGYVSSISGTILSTFNITSDNETKSLNLSPGIYSITAVKGTEKVSTKFIVK